MRASSKRMCSRGSFRIGEECAGRRAFAAWSAAASCVGKRVGLRAIAGAASRPGPTATRRSTATSRGAGRPATTRTRCTTRSTRRRRRRTPAMEAAQARALAAVEAAEGGGGDGAEVCVRRRRPLPARQHVREHGRRVWGRRRRRRCSPTPPSSTRSSSTRGIPGRVLLGARRVPLAMHTLKGALAHSPRPGDARARRSCCGRWARARRRRATRSSVREAFSRRARWEGGARKRAPRNSSARAIRRPSARARRPRSSSARSRWS